MKFIFVTLVFLTISLLPVKVFALNQESTEAGERILADKIPRAGDYAKKMSLLIETCSYKASIGDTSVLADCVQVITAFNGHMDTLINETKPNMTSILLG